MCGPVLSHGARVNPSGAQAPALVCTEEIGHRGQGVLVIDYLLMTSSDLDIKI